MEQQDAFTSAAKYTQDSIERCRHMAEFIRRRQAIEEEYAKALRTLTGSLILDAAFAESLQHQLLEPLNVSIREMDQGRVQLAEQGTKLMKDLVEVSASLKKARRKFDKSNKEAVEVRAALEKLHNNRMVTSSHEMEKLQVKTRKVEENWSLARQEFRRQEEAVKNCHKLQQQEVQRSRESLSYILGLVELERRCAVMNENYANDMALRLKQINLIEDEQNFTAAFMSVPLTSPLHVISTSMIAQPQSRVIGTPFPTPPLVSTSEIPRTLSMPPAYESQASTGLQDLVQYQGAASTNMLPSITGNHSRQVTVEIPSHP